MKVKLSDYKAWQDLKPSERERILNALTNQEEKDMQRVLDVYMKMSCIILHNAFGFGERRLCRFLVNYRRAFRQARSDVMADVQDERLNAQINRIFRKDGYPDGFFAGMFGGWNINTKGKDEGDINDH